MAIDYAIKSKMLVGAEVNLIWENKHFIVTTSNVPHIDKYDGGHITIRTKIPVGSISELSDDLLLKLFKLVGYCEQALIKTMSDQGIETPFTNNMDNGNWSALSNKPKTMHIHIYGRAKKSVKQTFGQALYFPDPNTSFYDNHTPLSQADIESIHSQLQKHYN
jgi:diadenosine tetraphosphate (Ap4A) HIT family hydrolase